MNDLIAYAKKAVLAGLIACVGTILGWNIPGWIDGTETFEVRSVLAGLVAAFIGGVAVYRATNGDKPT